MNNRKGFTLIELLVAITIIGIIMLMVLPAIHNLQRENQEKKFDDYERTILEAVKVYEDQYEEDLFGRSDNGCAPIDYDSLVQKKLISTTNISGYDCAYSGHDNGIIIRKVKGTSYYEIYLTCKKGGEEKKLTDNSGYSSIKNDHCDIGEDTIPPTLTIKCDGEGEPPIKGVQGDDYNTTRIYYYSYTNSNNKDEKRLPQLTVKISDNNSGLEKNQYVSYEWKIYERELNQPEGDPSSTEKNRTTFNIKDGAGSTSEKNVRIIEAFKEKDKTGKAIVDLKGENIVDRIGNKLDLQEGSKQCPYFYDNKAPEMEIKIIGDSGREYSTTSGEWIREPITTTVTVTDKTKDNTNNIYSGIDMENFKRNNTKEQLSAKDEATATHTYTLRDTNRKYDDIYRVCDKVGNCISQTVKIRVDTIYPTCKSRDGDSNWRNKNITIYGDCEDQGDPAHYSGCRKNVYSKLYSAEQSITNATAGEACDNAGNCVICSEDQPVHIDKTKPNCTTDGESTEWATSRTIKFNCEDPISGGVRSNCTQTTSETITYTTSTKTTSKTWNIEDRAGNPRTCTKNKVNVYMDNTDPICTHSISGENKPGELVYVSLTCTEPDGEIESVWGVDGHNSAIGDFEVAPGGSYSNPYTYSRKLGEGAYGLVCFNKAGGGCSYGPEIVESTCKKCPEDCCDSGWHLKDGKCCRTNGTVTTCKSSKTCYTRKCTSGRYCGYHVK